MYPPSFSKWTSIGLVSRLSSNSQVFPGPICDRCEQLTRLHGSCQTFVVLVLGHSHQVVLLANAPGHCSHFLMLAMEVFCWIALRINGLYWADRKKETRGRACCDCQRAAFKWIPGDFEDLFGGTLSCSEVPVSRFCLVSPRYSSYLGPAFGLAKPFVAPMASGTVTLKMCPKLEPVWNLTSRRHTKTPCLPRNVLRTFLEVFSEPFLGTLKWFWRVQALDFRPKRP